MNVFNTQYLFRRYWLVIYSDTVSDIKTLGIKKATSKLRLLTELTEQR
jgi:hypothetical protein